MKEKQRVEVKDMVYAVKKGDELQSSEKIGVLKH